MKPKVFVGSSSESLEIARSIQFHLNEDCEVVLWDKNFFEPSQTTIETLVKRKNEFDFAILVFTGDDKTTSRNVETLSPRDNIIFELGLFIAAIGRERTFVVCDRHDKPKIPSDLLGVSLCTFDKPNEDDFISCLGATATTLRNVIRKYGKLHRVEYDTDKVQGLRLFQHEGYYPIDVEQGTNNPSLNPEIFMKAVKYFLFEKNDRLAVTDLVYLREDNLTHIGDIIKNDADLQMYNKLVSKYNLKKFLNEFQIEQNKIFDNYVRIVNDFGDTFKDTHMEILLHNIRNPLRSIVALRNTEKISGRQKFDPSTRFVVQFVKNQGKMLMEEMTKGSKVRYLKQFNKTKKVKATTTPLFHERYGLIGILCVNIDIDSVSKMKKKDIDKFISDYIYNTGQTPDFEKEIWGVK